MGEPMASATASTPTHDSFGLRLRYEIVPEFAPYIGIEQFALNAPPAGSPLTAVLRVSSVEVAK